jgi:predicted GNAT family N-acyltransferase
LITVKTPNDVDFNYFECKKMFEQHQEVLDLDDFDTVINTTHFFSFSNGDEFIGCIYFYEQDSRVYVTAFAGRGHHELNLKCFKKSLEWYNCDIYAEKVQPTARYCILKCGFKRIKDDLFIYRRSQNGEI